MNTTEIPKLACSFVLPIIVALSLFSPHSNDWLKGLTLTGTILFCTATAIEVFTQDDK
jgi:hypothetical protein